MDADYFGIDKTAGMWLYRDMILLYNNIYNIWKRCRIYFREQRARQLATRYTAALPA